jgi:copper resistance protein B
MNRALYLAALLSGLSASTQGHSTLQEPATAAPQHAEQQTPPNQQASTESERRHVAPDPPKHVMGDMSARQMIELMDMNDAASYGMVLFDQFEARHIDGDNAANLELHAWYGNDYDKAWFKAEGDIALGRYEGRTELLLDRVFKRWWNLQAGVRHDFEAGPSRSWLAMGVQGLAPYWFEIEATAYVGDAGRTALRFSGEYELLITQRLILQPELDADMYGKDDSRNGIGAGLADTEIALRLRYEIRREFAPYVGIVWTRRYGDTADFARTEGRDRDVVRFTAGVRAWF